MYSLDHTHDPQLKSWVETANDANSDFPIQNLPFCVFRKDGAPAIGVGIGDQILDLRKACEKGLIGDQWGAALPSEVVSDNSVWVTNSVQWPLKVEKLSIETGKSSGEYIEIISSIDKNYRIITGF